MKEKTTPKASIPLIGQSMGKLFEKQLRVHVSPKKNITSGDIIVFLNEQNQLIAHRAVHWKGKIKTKGDANKNFDRYTIKRIIGVAHTKETWLQKKIKATQLKIQLTREYNKQNKKKK